MHRREHVTSNMLAEPNLGLCIGRAGQVIGSAVWDVVFSARFSTDYNLFRRGGNCLFPVYVYHSSGQKKLDGERNPNLNLNFIKVISKAIRLEFISDGVGDLKSTVGPEDVFHYVYSVLHSPEYRRRYAHFLKADFPRIPLTGDRRLFAALAELGQRLASLHLIQTDGVNLPAFPRTGSNRMAGVRYAPPGPDRPGRVWINADQYFEGIEPDTRAFAIGGHCPAEKWLKDRKRRSLSFEDIVHYRRICGALDETRRLMADIDAAIQRHGGWPLAKLA